VKNKLQEQGYSDVRPSHNLLYPVEAIEDWYEITIPEETLRKFCV
jgi:hypothetical protein